MAEIRKGIGKLAGSGLGKAGAELAGKEIGKEVEGEVTKVTSKVAGKKAGRAVGKAVGEATGEVVGDLAKDVLSTEAAQAAIGEIVGPHPGRAICSFCQGTTEIVLRVLAMLGSLAAIVIAAVAIGLAHHDTSINDQQLLNDSNITQELSRARRVVYGCGGYVIVIALLSISVELLLITIRWCNIGGVNLAINYFLIMDIILSSLFAILHAIGIGPMLYWLITYWNFSSRFQALQYSIIVWGAICVLSTIFYIILAVWSTLFRTRGWNKKVVKYTIKQVEHELAHKAKHAIDEKLKPIKSAL